ncbi:hypothetical protein CSOJ01_14172 [Colletotrichum sojae]|uniref:Uncharacterized protein n=1 Tax=Colletotrichum sojae TaxID=2175907 RepID=A0A8H6IRA9_9PEZI|nr:hypothetical protein CSOJ01_14172 [Colletotrichum sojae]
MHPLIAIAIAGLARASLRLPEPCRARRQTNFAGRYASRTAKGFAPTIDGFVTRSSISTTLTRSHRVIPTPAAVPISTTCPEIWIGMEAWRDRIRGAVAPNERIIAGFLGTERISRQSKLPRVAVLQAVVQRRPRRAIGHSRLREALSLSLPAPLMAASDTMRAKLDRPRLAFSYSALTFDMQPSSSPGRASPWCGARRTILSKILCRTIHPGGLVEIVQGVAHGNQDTDTVNKRTSRGDERTQPFRS